MPENRITRHRAAIRTVLAALGARPAHRRPLRAARAARLLLGLPARARLGGRAAGLQRAPGPRRRRPLPRHRAGAGGRGVVLRAAAGDHRLRVLPAVRDPARDLPLPQPRPLLDRRRDRERAHPRGHGGAAALGALRAAAQARRIALGGRRRRPRERQRPHRRGAREDARPGRAGGLPRVAAPLRGGRRPAADLRPPPEGDGGLLGARARLGALEPRRRPAQAPGRDQGGDDLRAASGAWTSARRSARRPGWTRRTCASCPRTARATASPTLEKLVLDYATGISRSPVDVPDELFERLRAQLDEAQLVELTSIIALENYRSRFNWAFGIEGQGFSEGAYCVRPRRGTPPPRAAERPPARSGEPARARATRSMVAAVIGGREIVPRRAVAAALALAALGACGSATPTARPRPALATVRGVLSAPVAEPPAAVRSYWTAGAARAEEPDARRGRGVRRRRSRSPRGWPRQRPAPRRRRPGPAGRRRWLRRLRRRPRPRSRPRLRASGRFLSPGC